MGKTNKNKWISIIPIIVAFLFGAILLGGFYYKSGFYFDTIDDVFISDMLKGVITGSPEYHTIHNGVLFTFPLTLLYRLNSYVPWYGIALLIMTWLDFSLPLAAAYSRCRKVFDYIVITVIFPVSTAPFLILVSYPQYTSTAIMTAFVGFVCLLLNKCRVVGIVEFGVMELLAYGLRPESMELVQPMGFALILAYVLWTWISDRITRKEEAESKGKVLVKSIGIPLALSVGIILVNMLIYNAAYSSSEWKQAISTHDARILLVDYYGFPETEEVADILAANGVEKYEYEAYKVYLNYGWDNTNGVLEQIAEYATTNKRIETRFSDAVKWTYANYKNWPWEMWSLIVSAIILEVVAIVICRKPVALLLNLFFEVSKLISWGFIYMKGRTPDRVVIPLFLIEIVSLLLITVLVFLSEDRSMDSSYKDEKRIIKRNEIGKQIVSTLILLAAIIPALFFSLRTTREEYRYIVSENSSVAIWEQIPEEFAGYCNSRTENRYLLAFKDYCYWKRGMLEGYSARNNYLYGGGWYVTLPTAGTYAKEYLDSENIYFIVNESDESTFSVQMDYLRNKYDGSFELEDSITLSTGITYGVYRVR